MYSICAYVDNDIYFDLGMEVYFTIPQVLIFFTGTKNDNFFSEPKTYVRSTFPAIKKPKRVRKSTSLRPVK